MAKHHAVHAIDKLPEHSQFVLLKFFAGAIDSRQLVMSICRRGGVTGKMLAAVCDPLPSHCLIECPGVAHDLLDSFSVAPAAQRVVSVVVK